MAWVTCPACGFTQIPAIQCLKCRARLDRTAAEPVPSQPAPSAPSPAPPAPGPPRLSAPSPRLLLGLGAAVIGLLAVIVVWTAGSGAPEAAPAPAPVATAAPWAFDLTGRWRGQVATTIRANPPRPALREISLETDRAGAIVGANVTLTDPGHGGAGAGYLTVPDGRRRVRELAEAVAAAPRGAAVSMDFIPLPPWVPRRERLWRAIEGQRRKPDEATYLLVESVEPDYLLQAGVNSSGFLSYIFLSSEYATGRGTDVLSRVIHPDRDSALRGFRNIVWDLSGAADFVTLQITATISEPAGSSDRLVLRRN